VLLIALALAAVRFTPLGDYLTRESLLGMLGSLQAAWWAPLLLIALYLLLCPLGLPATPLMIAGSIVFGPWLGTLYNFIGLLGGAVASYLVAQRLGGELIQHYGGEKLKRVERALHRHGFWYLVGARFFPLPFPAVNFAMALAGIRFLPFVLSTAIGLLPAIALWTYFYSALFNAAAGERGELLWTVGGALLLLGFVSLLPGLVTRRLRRRKYRRLLAERSGR
jgi:uncharacterized membrane protein YdjX (TVP38/TMEM64 family)